MISDFAARARALFYARMMFLTLGLLILAVPVWRRYFDFSPPTGEALMQWVLKAAQKENLPLAPEQARLLVELVGGDLMSLKSEIDKLALMCEDRGRALSADELGEMGLVRGVERPADA